MVGIINNNLIGESCRRSGILVTWGVDKRLLRWCTVTYVDAIEDALVAEI
jgi:hypothetical protein